MTENSKMRKAGNICHASLTLSEGERQRWFLKVSLTAEQSEKGQQRRSVSPGNGSALVSLQSLAGISLQEMWP